MDDCQSLNHTKWECKYHVVFIPKCRRKVLYGELRRHLGSVFRTLTEQKDSRVEEGHLMPDHVHMMLSIPPKHSVANIVGYIQGKSAIHIARTWGGEATQRQKWRFVPRIHFDDRAGFHRDGKGRQRARTTNLLQRSFTGQARV